MSYYTPITSQFLIRRVFGDGIPREPSVGTDNPDRLRCAAYVSQCIRLREENDKGTLGLRVDPKEVPMVTVFQVVADHGILPSP